MEENLTNANIADPQDTNTGSVNPFKPQAVPVSEGQVTQESSEASNDETKRFQYWQSRYDDLRKQHDATINEVNAYKPVVDYLSSNPDVVRSIDDLYTKKRNEKPAAPQRPNNFDYLDASTNPNSESYKYRQDMEQYRDAMANYLDTRIAKIDEAEGARRAQVEETQRQQASRAQLQEYLTINHQMKENEIIDFVNTFSSQESLSPDNLVRFYKFLKSEQQSVQNKPSSFNQRGGDMPPFGSFPGGSGGSASALSPDQEFGRSFLESGKKKLFK